MLTTDPLTGLPVTPATDPGFQLGNAPTRLPDAMFCKSKMQTDFYSLFHTKVDATIAWYGAHLPAFKKVHGYANNRSQDYFYNADRHARRVNHGTAGRGRTEHRWLFRVLPAFSAAAFRESDRFDGDRQGGVPVMSSSFRIVSFAALAVLIASPGCRQRVVEKRDARGRTGGRSADAGARRIDRDAASPLRPQFRRGVASGPRRGQCSSATR